MAKLSPKEYLEAGMDYMGYLEPEITSNEIYPDYIKKEVEDVIETVEQLQGYNTATFGFITDIHYANNFKYTHLIRLRRNLNAYKEIANCVSADFLCVGGDCVTNGSKKYVSDCFKALRKEMKDFTYMPFNGNHDDNGVWDGGCLLQEKAENHLLPEERYKLFFNHTPKKGAVYNYEERGLYYYVDNSDVKVRYIFLDTGDVPYKYNEKGSLKYFAQNFHAYSQAQLNWLANEALKFDEDGWAVMIFQHVPPFKMTVDDHEDLSRIAVLHDILTARRDNKDIRINKGEGDLHIEVNANFSNFKKCDIVGVMCGHMHNDDAKNVDGIQYIITANSVMYVMYRNPLNRFDGTKKELLFDIATINKTDRTLTLTRVGAGESRKFSY